MKKIAVILLSLLLTGFVCAAFALELDVSSMSASELYGLYEQVEAQLQLNVLEDPGAYAQAREHAKYVKNPYAFKKEKIVFTGTVSQIVRENDAVVAYFIAEGGKASQTYYVAYSQQENGSFLEGDEVQVWAVFGGLTTYTTSTGNTVSVPSCNGDLIIPPVTIGALSGASAEELQAVREQAGARLEEMNRTGKQDDGEAYEISVYNYEDFVQDEASYMLKKITFEARVVQVIEGQDYTQYRMAVDEAGDCVFLVQINKEDMGTNLLKGDEVTVTGVYYGMFTYKSTTGKEITVPSCLAADYTLKDYKPVEGNTADGQGYYWITGENYDDYARNPDDHKLEKIRFFGRVLQVLENDDRENRYRIAVDENIDLAFYVEYKLPQGAESIREDDVVMLSGTYYGLFTYSTALGTRVTVPAAIAQEIISAHRTLKRGSSGDDVLKMKERLMELGYFAQGAMITKNYNETTVERVKHFQQVNGLKPTGTADSRTLALLYSSDAKPNPD